MNIVSGKLGSVGEYALSLSGGKLQMEVKLPGAGLSDVLTEDASGLIDGLQALLDAKFPAEKTLIDFIMATIKSSLVAAAG